jgi:AraC-like DNA-binding protein
VVAQDLDFANDSHLCYEFRRLYELTPRIFGLTYRNPAACRVLTTMSRFYNLFTLPRTFLRLEARSYPKYYHC